MVADNIKLSICIPAYNQSNYLRECIAKVLEYKGADIEILVSDDASTENIEMLVEAFADNRIRYVKNEKNLGHDLNIINCFRHAHADFCFLLRTKDRLIPQAIPLLLEAIENNPCASYFTGTAMLPGGTTRITYKKNRYLQGAEAVLACRKLYIHPSGSAYAVKLLDLDAMQTFITANMDPKTSFLVHTLARMELAEKGDFVIIEEPLWVYSVTLKATEGAVNTVSSGVSPYDPSLTLQRYLCELKWVLGVLDGAYHVKMAKWLYKRCLLVSTWTHKASIKNKRFLQHYNVSNATSNIKKTRRGVLHATHAYLTEVAPNLWNLIRLNVFLQNAQNVTLGPLWYACARIIHSLRTVLVKR